jgi:excisionase family DNA binding protein
VSSSASYLTVREAAELVGLSDQAVRRAIGRGDLQATKPCNRIRIALDDVEAWLERNRVVPPAARQVLTNTRGLRQKLRDSDV